MQRAKLILYRGKEKSLQRRHPWIFSGAIQRVQGHPQEGDLVDVCDAEGVWMAVGHYQDDSIMVKVLDFDTPDVDMDGHPDFWRRRIQRAVDYRRQLGFFRFEQNKTNAFRLINGEGDFLPGLIVDYYNGVLVMQAHSEGMHRLFPALCDMLREELQEAAPVQSVFDKSAATLPALKYHGRRGQQEPSAAQLPPATAGAAPAAETLNRYIWGAEPEEWEIAEGGNRMLINFREGQKTGSFLDQRENHRLVGNLAQGKRVMNAFGYTGGFSLAALRGGAAYVETVDISAKALALCDRNVALNFPAACHKSVADDVLKYLDGADDHFDLIILDPPAFAKSRRTLAQGLKGYRAINQKAMEKLRPGGWLFTFSCSQAVSREDFQTMAFSAAALAHRRVRVVQRLSHAVDHPVSIYHPEGEYLKGLLLYVE